jgi:hypothetical protein
MHANSRMENISWARPLRPMDRMMQMTATKTRQGLLSFIAVIFLAPKLCATNASDHPGTPIEQGFSDMYNLDPSRGCDFLYDLESGAGKVDCYRITSPDAPVDASASDINGITPEWRSYGYRLCPTGCWPRGSLTRSDSPLSLIDGSWCWSPIVAMLC